LAPSGFWLKTRGKARQGNRSIRHRPSIREMSEHMTGKIPIKRTGEIAGIAALAAFAASRECSFTTGFTFDATGGRATY
jgi:NAD(P)-dependent dehydrogenase (short-subunit alcohol dehydrogenase family)